MLAKEIIKNVHSLALQAQATGRPIGKLKGEVNPGYYPQVEETASELCIVLRMLG